MRIQHNIAALNSHRNLSNNNSAVSKNLEKLSSGYRINRAGDDAAGLAISEKMRAQITGLQTAQKNAEDGVGLVQTAEGALTEVHSMLNRMVELATQSANGTYSEGNREEMQKEVEELKKEINRISSTANFNGKILFQKESVQIAEPDDAKSTVTDGSGSAEATVAFDFTGATFDKDGFVTVTVGGKDYSVEVKKDMTDAEFATKFVEVYNADKISDTTTDGAGEFTAAVDGTTGVKLTSASQAAIGDAALKTALGKEIAMKPDTTPRIGDKNSVKLHVGESSSDDNTIEIKIDAMHSNTLGLTQKVTDADGNETIQAMTGKTIADVDIKDEESAKTAIDIVNGAIDQVSSIRSSLGAMQNRLEHTINNLGVQNENITAAEARIRDVDMAKEMMTYTKNNILVQASQAMLAQANQVPQGVLQLLQ